MLIGRYRINGKLRMLVAVGVIYLWMTVYLVSVLRIDRPYAAGAVPVLYVFATITLIALVATSIRVHHVPAADAGAGEQPVPTGVPARLEALIGPHWRRSLAFLALMVGYAFTFEFLGLLPATLVFVLAGLLVTGTRKVRPLVIVPLAICLGGYALAAYLQMPLDWGIFGELFGAGR